MTLNTWFPTVPFKRNFLIKNAENIIVFPALKVFNSDYFLYYFCRKILELAFYGDITIEIIYLKSENRAYFIHSWYDNVFLGTSYELDMNIFLVGKPVAESSNTIQQTEGWIFKETKQNQFINQAF